MVGGGGLDLDLDCLTGVVAGLLQLVLALIDGELDVALLEHLLLEVFFSLLAMVLDALGCSPLDIVVALVWASLIA